MNHIRQVVREQIEALMSLKGQNFQLELKKLIDYINDFEFVGYKQLENKEAWAFFGKKGFAVFKIFIIHSNGSWRFILNIIDDSNDLSHDSNKTEIGPFNDFEEFIKKIRTNLDNNLVIGKNVFNDKMNDSKEEIVVKCLNDLEKKEQILITISSPNMDRLKNIYSKYKSTAEKDIKNRIEILANEFNGIDGLIVALQDVEKIDFYNSLNGLTNEES